MMIINFLVVLLFRCAPEKSTQYLKEVEAIDRWLQTTKVESDGFLIWPDALDMPEQVTNSISSGVAGKLLFYLQAHRETGNIRYLEETRLAAHYLLEHLPQRKDSLDQRSLAFSPYGNVCGAAFALLEAHGDLGDPGFQEGAEHILDLVKFYARNKEDTLSWDLGNDVLGGLAGTGLFLLHAGERLGREDLLIMAKQAGNTLISRANKDNGYSWKRGQDDSPGHF